jgi:hypothetical protein
MISDKLSVIFLEMFSSLNNMVASNHIQCPIYFASLSPNKVGSTHLVQKVLDLSQIVHA